MSEVNSQASVIFGVSLSLLWSRAHARSQDMALPQYTSRRDSTCRCHDGEGRADVLVQNRVCPNGRKLSGSTVPRAPPAGGGLADQHGILENCASAPAPAPSRTVPWKRDAFAENASLTECRRLGYDKRET